MAGHTVSDCNPQSKERRTGQKGSFPGHDHDDLWTFQQHLAPAKHSTTIQEPQPGGQVFSTQALGDVQYPKYNSQGPLETGLYGVKSLNTEPSGCVCKEDAGIVLS